VALRRGGNITPAPAYWRCTELGRQIELAALGRAVRQAALLGELQQAPGAIPEQNFTHNSGWRSALARLCERGWVELSEAPARSTSNEIPSSVELNESQMAAASTITASLGEFNAYLLDGVTGSGKTEVYLEAIREVVAQGKQALVLVPEIGLTPQIVARFAGALTARVGVMHSNISDGARLRVWTEASSARIDVVIGTRSAIFTPLARLGIIVVDEEHDLSFKQQDGFRYSARDLAVVRARAVQIPIVLGSATPSFESLHNSATARYSLLRLKTRAAGAQMPGIRIIDIRNRHLEDGLSQVLIGALGERLARGEQSLLFVNRRGFAPVLLCHDCGWVCDCDRCDSHMVLHAANGRIRCHHCGAERPPPTACHACGSSELVAIGTGTERVARALQTHFPKARVARVDRDTVRRIGAIEALLEEIQTRQIDVVVGTQMVAKGHHFPHVTLVGVLDADGGLFGADFRAAERMAQLIVQVAGRAGRGAQAGEVLIQTHHPMHPLLQSLRGDGYSAFAEQALQERHHAQLPPYASLVLVRAEAAQREAVFDFLNQAQRLASELANTPAPNPDSDPQPMPITVLGPVAAPMERRSGRYRAQLLLQCTHRGTLHALLTPFVDGISAMKTARKVRWSLDVDPQEML